MFLPTVALLWNQELEGHHMFEVISKLKMLKPTLKQFHNLNMEALNENTTDEKCHSYFFRLIKSRRTSTQISTITHLGGSLITSQYDIAKSFIKHYVNLLGTTGSLNEAFTTANVKEAIFSIGKNKSSSPNNYNAFFFRKAWPIIGAKVSEAILDFFYTGKLLKQVNHTTLILVLKNSIPSSISCYRPIACCTTIYKSIAKLMAKKLKLVLPDAPSYPVDPLDITLFFAKNSSPITIGKPYPLDVP
ncbi:hypothetical protein V2J09_013824 [Rumex salicifolius]